MVVEMLKCQFVKLALIIRLGVQGYCKIWLLEARHKLKNSFQKVLVKFYKLDSKHLFPKIC